MLDIMKFLTQELKKISPRVFNGNATKDAVFPYVVFKIPTSNIMEKNREDVIIEIDVWDIQKDGYDATINVEVLTSEIDNFLKNARFNGDNAVLIFQKMNRLSLPDEDENIKHRQLRYLVKFYDKSQ